MKRIILYRRIVTMLLIILCLGMWPMQVLATDTAEETPEEAAEKVATEEAYAQPVDSNTLKNWPEGPAIHGESGIVMDMKSGAILYSKNMDVKQYPASITKIMTALIAIENSELTDKVVFSNNSISFLEYGDAHIGMKKDEEINMEDALYGILLASANEVSYAVAETVGGSYDNFIKMMNDKAKELGCTGTNFTNPHGLYDENHYITARDMALISAAAFKNEEFRKITNTRQYTIKATNITAEERTFQQNHKMIQGNNPNFYENCVGGKTGYTKESLTTLVTYADYVDMQLVAVNLKTHGANVYPNVTAMLTYVRENFIKVPIENARDLEDVESIDKDAYIIMPNTFTLDDVKVEIRQVGSEKDRLGTAVYSYEGQIVGTIGLKLKESYFKKEVDVAKVEPDKKKVPVKKAANKLRVVFIIVAVIIVLFGILLMLALIRRKQIRKARKRKKNREQIK